MCVCVLGYDHHGRPVIYKDYGYMTVKRTAVVSEGLFLIFQFILSTYLFEIPAIKLKIDYKYVYAICMCSGLVRRCAVLHVVLYDIYIYIYVIR